MGGQLGLDGVEGLAGGALHVDGRGGEGLAHRLGDDGAHLRVVLPALDDALELVAEGGEVEVPVVHRAQLGRGAGELRDGGDELLGLELVALVALVGVGLLGLAAAHRAAALDLAAVEELVGLDVVELAGAHLPEEAALVQAADHLVGEAGVDLRGRLEAAPGVQVERDAVGVERRGLGLVEGADVVEDRALVPLLADLAVALHDRRAVAVRAGDEDDVVRADAVAQEARGEVRGDEHAGDVAEVEVLVAVGHAGGHDGARREAGAVL